MRPVSVFPDYLVKLVIPASRAITKPAVICRCVPLEGIPSPSKGAGIGNAREEQFGSAFMNKALLEHICWKRQQVSSN